MLSLLQINQSSFGEKGFGLGKALVGGFLTGGFGLMAGFIGSNKIKITCLNCGKKSKAGDLQKKQVMK